MADHVESIIEGYIDLFGDDSSAATPAAPELSAGDHTRTALDQTSDLDSQSADGYRSNAQRTIALADILSGLDTTTVQLIMDNARDNTAVRDQLKVWLTEYQSNKQALKSFLGTPTGQAALAAMAANTLTTATTATQAGADRNSQRAAMATTVGDQYAAQTPAAATTTPTGMSSLMTAPARAAQTAASSFARPRDTITQQAAYTPRGGGHGGGGGGGSRGGGFNGGGSGGSGGYRPQFSASPSPSFSGASSGGSGGFNATPAAAVAPTGGDYSWVSADPSHRSEVSTNEGQAAVKAAESALGLPYAWGGGGLDGPSQGIHDGGVADSYGDYNKVGFDCSGLVRYAIYQASHGAIILPRTTYDMVNEGVPISFDQLQPGDIIFPNPGHVQLYIGDGKVIEAQQSGTNVMISPVGNSGVARRVL